MTKPATKAFLTCVLLSGLTAAVWMFSQLSIADPIKFVCYTVIALGTALLKLRFPGMYGNLTVNFLIVLIGLAELTLPECMLAGLLAAVIQSLVNITKRPRPVQVLFNLSVTLLSIASCGAVFLSVYLKDHGAGLLLRLTLAAVTYFIVNTSAIAAIISLTESTPMLRVWRQWYLWVFPFYFAGGGVAWIFHRLAAAFGWQAAMLSLPSVYLMYSAYHFYLGRLQTEKSQAEDIAALHLRTIEALAMAIDAKDHGTHDHLQRVKIYASEIGRELKMPAAELEALEAAAMLHDIGNLAVPEHIVSKPGRLTSEEFEKMKIHPIVGADILKRANFPYPVVPIVRSHHERWDGTGYPDGLAREAIPLGARILAVVDCLDALASDRQYRSAVSLERAMSMIEEEAGKAFDPRIVDVLKRRYWELEAKTRSLSVPDSPMPVNANVARGEVPASGPVSPMAGSEASAAGEVALPGDKSGFLTSIAAARQEMQTLFELSTDLGPSLRRSEMLSLFASKLRTIIPYDLICIYAVHDDVLHPEYVAGSESGLFSSMRIPVGEGLSGWAAQHNSPVLNGKPSVEHGYLNDPTVTTNLSSALAVPFGVDGDAIGVLTLYSTSANAFSRDHLRVLQTMGPRLGAALSHDRELSEARDNAVTDFLTGLPNSRSLYLQLDAELARARGKGGSLGVLMCDLDGFKNVNDEFGHQQGDRALRAVAAALRDSCRNSDYVARMGGDEFVIVLRDPEDTSLTEQMQHFRRAVEISGAASGFPGLSLSIGGLVPDLSADADTILTEADRRMYLDKRRRRVTGPAKPDVLNLARTPGSPESHMVPNEIRSGGAAPATVPDAAPGQPPVVIH